LLVKIRSCGGRRRITGCGIIDYLPPPTLHGFLSTDHLKSMVHTLRFTSVKETLRAYGICPYGVRSNVQELALPAIYARNFIVGISTQLGLDDTYQPHVVWEWDSGRFLEIGEGAKKGKMLGESQFSPYPCEVSDELERRQTTGPLQRFTVQVSAVSLRIYVDQMTQKVVGRSGVRCIRRRVLRQGALQEYVARVLRRAEKASNSTLCAQIVH